MIEFHFLGTCSGTEPFENMHHCSWIMSAFGKNYWFDAGENCAHRAYVDGIEIMNTAAIFISHMHIDHTGGLANLFALFVKLKERYKKTLINNNTLELFMPRPEMLDIFKYIVFGNIKKADLSFDINSHAISDGHLYSDENISVSALHNLHLKEDGSDGYHSFSFGIKAENKNIVYSGDVRHINELDSLFENGCDVFIMETGHHSVQDVLEYALCKKVKVLRFIHHGRQILENRESCEKLCEDFAIAHNMDIKICKDGDILIIN